MKSLALISPPAGPIVRITPNEVHLSDPENYDKIYHVGTKYFKDPDFYGAFGNSDSMFVTASNELHRVRRSGLSHFFSRTAVLEHEDIVQEKVRKLLDLIQHASSSNESIDMHHGLRAVSVDVVTDYAFGESYNLLDRSDLGLKFFTLTHKIGPAAWLNRQVPWLKPLAKMMPKKLLEVFSKPMEQVRDLQNVSQRGAHPQ